MTSLSLMSFVTGGSVTGRHHRKVFGLPVQARDTKHQQLTRFTFPRSQDLGNSLVTHRAVAICQHSCYNILTVREVCVSLHDFSGYILHFLWLLLQAQLSC